MKFINYFQIADDSADKVDQVPSDPIYGKRCTASQQEIKAKTWILWAKHYEPIGSFRAQ